MRFLLLNMALCLLLLSCNQESDLVLGEDQTNYYPLTVGQYRTYYTEEIRFSLLDPDTSFYYLKEVIDDSIITIDGSVKYLINRYVSSDNVSFDLDSVWAVQKLERAIVVTENNIPFVKLIEPVKSTETWDGNAYNTLSEVTYYYQTTGALFDGIANEITSLDLIDVIIEDIPVNLVNQDERRETYAMDVGLVQKDYISLEFCTLDCGEVGEIQSGRILKQWLIEYGAK